MFEMLSDSRSFDDMFATNERLDAGTTCPSARTS